MKHEWLAAAGVDYLVELPPTPEVLNVTAERFWELLRDDVKPSHLVEGASFNFGKGRAGTIDRLREWCAASDVQLHEVDGVTVPLLNLQIVPVSSSLVRWLIASGRVRDAAICLGRPYLLRGPVVQGHQRGRTIGVPTANLNVTEQLIPAEGVYAARCAIDGTPYAAALSIGTMPTFGDHPPQVEAHLIGYTGDLYGRTLDLEVIDWLRDQMKFPGVEALKAQLARDIATAKQLAGFRTAEPIASMSG
jgi:riboflavin kinase/FMN adenylyltransferase